MELNHAKHFFFQIFDFDQHLIVSPDQNNYMGAPTYQQTHCLPPAMEPP